MGFVLMGIGGLSFIIGIIAVVFALIAQKGFLRPFIMVALGMILFIIGGIMIV